MKYQNRTILWGDTKLIVVDNTKQHKTDHAIEMVEGAVAGELGFCYKQIKKYPMATGEPIRTEMILLKRERDAYHTIRARRELITEKLANLRRMEREHYMFDEFTFNLMRSNYDKLHRALTLLVIEGEVKCYTLKGDGTLRVEWFTDYVKTELVVIQQGWTFGEHIPYDNKRKLRERVFSTYGVKFNADRDYVSGAPSDPMCSGGQMYNGGYIETANLTSQQVTKGSGELDPVVLMEREASYAGSKAENKALYINAADARRKQLGKKLDVTI